MDLLSPEGEFKSEIEEFDSWKHFHRVRQEIERAVRQGILTEVPPVGWYAGPMTEQRWLRTPAGAIWRLVTPDPPLYGVLEVVEDPTEDNSQVLRLMQEVAYRGDIETVQASWKRLAADEASDDIAEDLRRHIAELDAWKQRHPWRYRLRKVLQRWGVSRRGH